MARRLRSMPAPRQRARGWAVIAPQAMQASGVGVWPVPLQSGHGFMHRGQAASASPDMVGGVRRGRDKQQNCSDQRLHFLTSRARPRARSSSKPISARFIRTCVTDSHLPGSSRCHVGTDWSRAGCVRARAIGDAIDERRDHRFWLV
jgi:hypothetical protein